MICRCPVRKLNLCHQSRLKPTAFFHHSFGQCFTSACTFWLRQVSKRAFLCSEIMKSLSNFPPKCGRKTVSHFAQKHQSVALVIADQQRVKNVRSTKVTSNYKFL